MQDIDDKVEVEIYGQSYSLKGEGNREYINRLASYVDKKMKEVTQRTPTVDSLKVAILAALNIADEYLQIQDKDDDYVGQIAEKTEALAEMLEQELG